MTSSESTDSPRRWSREVERIIVAGHPCLAYAHRPRSLAELLVDARRWDDRTFVVAGNRRLGFLDFQHAVARVGRHLAAQGVGRGDRVLLLGYNSLEWLVAFWALQWIGAVGVLGNAWWSDDESRTAVRLVEPSAVITDRVLDLASGGARSPISMRSLAGVIDSKDVVSLEAAAVAEDDMAIIMFSSGTTGVAKGVVMSHRSVVANIQNLLVLTGRLPVEIDAERPATVSLLTMPLFHLAGVQISFGTLLSGGRLVLLEGRFEPEAVLGLIEKERVRVWGGVPTMVSRVIDCARFADFDTSSLRSIPMGGAALSPELRAKIQRAFPAIKKQGGSSLYGLTEAGGVLAAGSGDDMQGRPQCVGRPLPVVELKIAHPDAQGVGEIFARTPSVTGGYWKDAAPIVDAEGWVRTGDLGRIDAENYLYIVGRSKDIIIRGGENIASQHVEHCLAEHPDVLECAVVPLAHADLGEEVAAAVVVRPGATVTAEDLRRHAAARLGKFEVPSRWWLRSVALPTNASGKILKRAVVDSWPAESSD